MNTNIRKPLILSLLFLLSFGLYLSTLSPGIYFGDTGELISMGKLLGIPHPTGFPLYILLLKLVSMISFANPAFMAGLMSAAFGALVPVAVYMTADLVSRKASEKTEAMHFITALIPSLLIMLSYTLWSQTVAARIYTLNALAIALCIYLYFSLTETTFSSKKLFLFAFLTGAGAGLHLSFIVCSVILWTGLIIKFRRPVFKKLPALLFFFLTGLSVYLYIIIRGLGATELHWKNFLKLQDFIAYFTQQQYKAKMASRGLAGYLSYFRFTADVMLREFSIPGIILLASAMLYSLVRRKAGSVLLSLIFISSIALLAVYGTFTDMKLAFRYFIPSYLALAILSVYAVSAFISAAGKKISATVLFCAFVLTAAFMIPKNYYENDRSRNFTAYDYTNDILRSMPSDKAYLFTSGDNQIYTLAYAKFVEGRAKNLTIYDATNTIFRDSDNLAIKSGSYKFISNALTAIREQKLPLYSATKVGVPIISESLNGILYSIDSYDRPNRNAYWKMYPLRLFYSGVYHEFEEREVLGTYYYRLAEKYLTEGKGPTAFYLVTMAEKTAFDSLTVLGNTALIYSLYNDFTNAERLIKKALELNPENPELLFNLGSMYGRQGKFLESSQAFESVLKVDPNNMNAMMYAQKAQEQYSKQMAEKALIDQRDGAYNEGVRLFDEKKFDEAIPKFMEDFSKNPVLARAEFHLALIYSIKKEYEKAIPYYESAIRKEPKNVNTLNNLAMTYGNMGKMDMAKKYFKMSIEINPDQVRVKDILKKLK